MPSWSYRAISRKRRLAVRLDVLDRLNAGHRRSEPVDGVAPVQQRQGPQVLAVEFEQVKHDEHGRSKQGRMVDQVRSVQQGTPSQLLEVRSPVRRRHDKLGIESETWFSPK